MDWRKLEAKLIDLIRQQSDVKLCDDINWDKVIADFHYRPIVNLTQLARDLAWELTNDPV